MNRARSQLCSLREGVARQERELRTAFTELSVATRAAADPAQWIRARPFVCVLGALAFGLWLGGRGRAGH